MFQNVYSSAAITTLKNKINFNFVLADITIEEKD